MGCGGALLVLAWAITASANQIRDSLDNNAKQQLLTAHNTARAARGACPLEWSNTLEDSIVKTPEMINCGSSLPDDIPPGTTWSSVYVQKEGDVIDEYIRLINDEETSFTGTATRQTRNYVQAVWKASKTMGCRSCLEPLEWGGYQAFTMCKFDPPGNVAGTEKDNIGKVGETCDMCQGKTCPPPSQCHIDGQCDTMTGECINMTKADGTQCDDGNAVTVNDVCTAGECKGEDKCKNVVCTPLDACHIAGVCDPQTGVCSNPVWNRTEWSSPDDGKCDDGNPNTADDTCIDGVCKGTDQCASAQCPVGGPCRTSSQCDRKTGKCSESKPLPDGTDCDDNDALTTGDKCQGGQCVGTHKCDSITCVAQACQLFAWCDRTTGSCVHMSYPDGATCQDGNPATVFDKCVNGTCIGTNLCEGVTCPGEDECNEASTCDRLTGQCTSMPKARPVGDSPSIPIIPCDDGDATTVQDTCTEEGMCIGVNLCLGVTCAPPKTCQQAGVCDYNTGKCVYPPASDGEPCDDGDASTVDDKCASGVCKGVNKCIIPPDGKVICQPKGDCFVAGVCQPATGLCTNPVAPDGTPCNDGNADTVKDKCEQGVCKGVPPCMGQPCPASDQCKMGKCDVNADKCIEVNKPDNVTCDDGNAATVRDQCVGGVCTGTDLCAGVTCVAMDQCHEAGTCDYATGQCSNPPKKDQTQCDDGNPITVDDVCKQGECRGVDKCANVQCEAGGCKESGKCNHKTGQCEYVFFPDGHQCDDNDATTGRDTCQSGTCVGEDLCKGVTCPPVDCHSPGKCEAATGKCMYDTVKDGEGCDDKNPDTVLDACRGGVCVGEPKCQGKPCDAMSVCKVGRCDIMSNQCVEDNEKDGTKCSDSNPRTVNDVCKAGVCTGEDLCAGVTCSAAGECYDVGECNYLTGNCTTPKKKDGTACNDGNPRTVDDKCSDGVCKGVDKCKGVICSAKDACHAIGVCDVQTGVCSDPIKPNGTACDDGNNKTVQDQCSGGVCTGIDLCIGVTCKAIDECHDAGECYHGTCSTPAKADGASCDDGDDGTVLDKCVMGKCKGEPPCGGKECPSSRPCGKGYCDKKQNKCMEMDLPDETGCDDGQDKTIGDRCLSGKCVGTDLCANVTCVAVNPCQTPGQCNHLTGLCSTSPKPDGTPCDDGQNNTVEDSCKNGACVGVDKCLGKACAPRNNCYLKGRCDINTGNCIETKKADKTPCDDGNNRTVHDMCFDGECRGEDKCKGVVCSAVSECHEAGTCDPFTGMCSTPPAADGKQCDDGVVSTVNDTCLNGTCTGKDLCKGKQCTGGDVCNEVPKCDYLTGECLPPVPKKNGTQCDDGLPNTVQDACQDGVCKGVNLCKDVVCIPKVPCETGSCDTMTGKCVFEHLPDDTECNDGDARTGDDMCKGGKCVGRDLCANYTCTAKSQCHKVGVCDPSRADVERNDTLCTSPIKEDGTVCDDNDAETVGDVCRAGKCIGVSCKITVVKRRSKSTCTFGKKGGRRLDGGFGFTPEGHMYVDAGCRADFRIEATSQEIRCESWGFNYKECRLSPRATLCAPAVPEPDGEWLKIGRGYCLDKSQQRLSYVTQGSVMTPQGCMKLAEGSVNIVGVEYNSKDHSCSLLHVPGAVPVGSWASKKDLPGIAPVDTSDGSADVECYVPADRCIGVTCVAIDDCHDIGVCNNASGTCTTPAKPDGSLCDDGDDTTKVDICKQGNCTGTTPPGCYRASRRVPSQECAHDDSACGSSEVWGTMEECCRPGNAHPNGCAPAPEKPKECWAASKYFPNRECAVNKEACDWTWGTSVWGSKAECCRPGAAHKCGCSDLPKNCFKATGTMTKRECEHVPTECGKGENEGVFTSRERCCKKTYGEYGCHLPCRTLDVVFVVDGSGSMKASFGRHPHGYNAIMDMLYDWVGEQLPLTGEKAGDKSQARPPQGGVRVGIIQFSAQRSSYGRLISAAKTVPSWVGTGGRLSGDANELRTDLKWHRQYFYNSGTYIQKAFSLAISMFQKGSDERQRVLILLTDGKIFDANTLPALRRQLDDQKVIVFGVVVRRQTSHTQTDLEAERTLKPILSRPEEDHFYNLPIDEVPDKVLKGICDEKGKWGCYLVPQAVPEKPSTGYGKVYFENTELRPFRDANCQEMQKGAKCGCDTMIPGLTVSIEEGYAKGKDTLSCPECPSLGLHVDFKSTTGVLEIMGYTTVERMTQALSKVVFLTTSSDGSDRAFTFNLGHGVASSTLKGHYYEYFCARRITWGDAQQKCAEYKLNGMPGYLMTITSEEEQRIAKEKVGGQGWIGASDSGEEGVWKWVTGPEGCPPDAACDVGANTWRGQGKSKGGSIINYTNWASGEPNDYKRSDQPWKQYGEDFGHLYFPSGKWNDYWVDHEKIDGFLCEWGGLGESCLAKQSDTRRFVNGMYQPAKCEGVPSPVPLPESGCLAEWAITPFGKATHITPDWCKDNCISRSTTNLRTECTPQAGAKQLCSCPPDQVAQCRCTEPTDDDEYCANLAPEKNGKYKCAPVQKELDGMWFSKRLTYNGVPPASTTDKDPQFECHSHDGGKWKKVGEGQCQDSAEKYFARYKTTKLDLDGCKRLCEEKKPCHAVHWTHGPQGDGECTLNVVANKCSSSQRLCKQPGKKPKGAGDACGCVEYALGASPSHSRVCAWGTNATTPDTVCTPVTSAGECPAGSTLCAKDMVLQLTVKVTDIQLIKDLLASAAGKDPGYIQLLSLCKKSMCVTQGTSTKCKQTEKALQDAGCLTGEKANTAGASRHFSSLADEDSVVSFDFKGLSDADRTEALERIRRHMEVAKLTNSDLNIPGVDSEAVAKLRASGGELSNTYPPADFDLEDYAAAPSQTKDSSDDSGSGSGMYLGIAFGVLVPIVLGVALYGLYARRKSRVRWSDVALNRADLDVSAPELDVEQYKPMSEMQDVAALDEDTTSSSPAHATGGLLSEPAPLRRNASLLGNSHTSTQHAAL